jgi:glycine oxidase
MPQDVHDVIIVGAGIVGCSTGYYLSRSGLKVAIVDKGSTAGEASRAAGMLAPKKTRTPPVFPVKGQMMALQGLPELHLRHTVYAAGVGGIVPKADGTIYVGATVEEAGFDNAVTAEGLAILLVAVTKLTPALSKARVVRTWAGLRPGIVDGLPLIGPSRTVQGLWVAGGHFRDGILLGPVTGHIMSELIQRRPSPVDLDLQAFDPDRFGGWDHVE